MFTETPPQMVMSLSFAPKTPRKFRVESKKSANNGGRRRSAWGDLADACDGGAAEEKGIKLDGGAQQGDGRRKIGVDFPGQTYFVVSESESICVCV